MSKKTDISDKIMRIQPNENQALRYFLGPPQFTGWRRLIHRLFTSRERLKVEKSELDAFLERRQQSQVFYNRLYHALDIPEDQA